MCSNSMGYLQSESFVILSADLKLPDPEYQNECVEILLPGSKRFSTCNKRPMQDKNIGINIGIILKNVHAKKSMLIRRK
jgi:hypothetical protein